MARHPAVREWFLRYTRAQLTQRGALHAARANLKAPLRAVREAHRGYGSFGAGMRAPDRPSRLRLYVRHARLDLARRLKAREYYRFGLYRPERWVRRALYVAQAEGTLASRYAAHLLYENEFRIVNDKRRFGDWCERQGLPAVRILGTASDGQFRWNVEPDGAFPRLDVFLKLAQAYGGVNTMQALWKDGAFHCSDGVARTPDEMLGMVKEWSRAEPVVVQPLLVNHPVVRALSVRALNTCRLTTCRTKSGGVTTVAAAIRIALGDSTADNVAQGGIAAGIDLTRGTLSEAVLIDKHFDEHRFSRHPDTGAQITGLELPDWGGIRGLAERGHSLLDVPCLSWDIAILESGPVVVEANWNGDNWVPQVVADTPLFGTSYDDSYAEPLGSLIEGLSDEELIRISAINPFKEKRPDYQ